MNSLAFLERKLGSAQAPSGRIEIVQVPPDLCTRKQNLRIYLPPTYDHSLTHYYPVVYIHFSNDLFGPSQGSSESWNLHRLIDRLIALAMIDEVIVVGIDTMRGTVGHDQNHYNNLRDDAPGSGMGGLLYEHFILNHLLPFINKRYRTQTDAGNTVMAGACAGATVTYNIAERNPGVFGKIAILSPAVLSLNGTKRLLAPQGRRPKGVVWLYTGSLEGEYTERVRCLAHELISSGAEPDLDLFYLQEPNAPHRTSAWGECMLHPLLLFFGKTGKPTKLEIHGDSLIPIVGETQPLTPILHHETGFRATPLQSEYSIDAPSRLQCTPNGQLVGLSEGCCQITIRTGEFSAMHRVRVVTTLPSTVRVTLSARVIDDQPSIKKINFGNFALLRTEHGDYKGTYDLPRGFSLGENFSCRLGKFEVSQTGDAVPLRIFRAERDSVHDFTIAGWPPVTQKR